MGRILIIDDDAFICNVLEKHLSDNGYDVDASFSAAGGKKLLKDQEYDLVLCDYRLPESDGFKMLKIIKKLQPDVGVVIITAYADVKIAVKLIKQGAAEYIVKPIQKEELLHIVKELLTANNSKAENSGTSSEEEEKNADLPNDFFFGKDQAFHNILNMAEKVAPTNMGVLIQGATGSGKEYLAQYIHQKSKRNNKPFVALDCGAIPKSLADSELFGHRKGSFTGALADKTGVFQEANGGTLFLDEVGNLDYEVQVKLLRTLQERTIAMVGDANSFEVDVRIIAASNEDLREQVESGDFREDLYHRLNEFQLEIPSLNKRGEDLLLYSEYFIDLANRQLGKSVAGLDDKVREIFLSYSWEGNLRELKNVLKRAVLLSESELITPDTLPEEIRNHHLYYPERNEIDGNEGALKESSLDAEREVIIQALREMNNNKSKAARKLGIDRKTLYNKMNKLDIDPNPGV